MHALFSQLGPWLGAALSKTGRTRNVAESAVRITRRGIALAVAFVMAVQVSCRSGTADQRPMRFVTIDREDRLEYGSDERSNRIPDFSHAGFAGGGAPIPNVPVRMTLSADGDDDGARIQDALDKLATLPLDEHGFRGALLLKNGVYRIDGSIKIRASGIVLRGEGSKRSGTVLLAAGISKRTLIVASGGDVEYDDSVDETDERPRQPRDPGPREIDGSRRGITDEYVPIGARRFNVEHIRGLEVGDSIIVHRPSTSEWIEELGMDRIPPRDDGREINQWKAGSRDLLFDRKITAIHGNQITIDAPLTNAIERRWTDGSIYRYEYPQRIRNIGIENLRGDCEFKAKDDEDHAWSFIGMDVIENAWVRDVIAEHFAYSAVHIGSHAKWITVQDCQCKNPVSQIIGSRRYAFAVRGQMVLVQRCTSSRGRHDFVNPTGPSCGPNVFLDCTA